MLHERFICPVGQGGFSVEIIEDHVVVYDCGSSSSHQMVESCVDYLAQLRDHVDLLFISHFDKDHVNSIRYLLRNIQVRQAVTTFIPSEMRVAYGVYTNGAYAAIMGLLRDNDVEVVDIGREEREEETYFFKDIWEWIAKSMMTQTDFSRLRVQLQAAGIDLDQVDIPDYVEHYKGQINSVFKTCFGSKGPNAKGLIVLSQRCVEAPEPTTIIFRGCRHMCLPWDGNGIYIETSCLYVGDADLKNKPNNQMVTDFLDNHRREPVLLMMQIPHHGSQHNISAQFEVDFPARFYFVNDIDTKRLQKSENLFVSLTNQKKLMVSRGLCKDLIVTETEIRYDE